jgi:hypothetical protein
MIYFRVQNRVWSMASDGSSKSQLPAGVDGDPSRLLHGGRRWFLNFLQVGGTYTDGTPRAEVVAVRDDAQVSVQLTNDAAAKPTWVRWAKDDGFASICQVDWSGGAPASRLVRVPVSFDASGSPEVAGAASAVVSVGQVQIDGTGAVYPTVTGHDWSPDGDRVVWTETSSASSALRITTVDGATTTLTAGSYPSWSNDGTAIAFTGPDGVEAIAPDGSAHRVVVRNGSRDGFGRPDWSPTGSHVAYWRWSRRTFTGDVLRATSGGAGATDLTSDVQDPALPVGWR